MNPLGPPTPLIPIASGNTKEVTYFNQSRKNHEQRTVRGGVGVKVSYKVDHTLVELDQKVIRAAGGESAGIKRCRIDVIHANYLECLEYESDGYTVGASPLNVAIPYFLRASTYANLTLGGFTYVTTGGQIRCSQAGFSGYVTKAFFPPYGTGQDIYAIQPAGKTDVTVTDNLLEWVDSNTEGRRLDTNHVQLTVCRREGGIDVSRNVVVEGGPVY